MNGKQKCKILKEIRAEIARNNEIEYVTSECRHKGDCKGTCPRCEAELRYLEKELEKRQRLGKTVVVAGLTASITLSAAGCIDWLPTTTDGMMEPSEQVEELMGDVPLPPEVEETQILVKGEMPDTELLAGVLPETEDVAGELVAPEDLLEGEIADEGVDQ